MRKLLLFPIFILLVTSCSLFFTNLETPETPRAETTPILQGSQENTTTSQAQIATESRREPTSTADATEPLKPVLPKIIQFRPDQIHRESLCPIDDFVLIQDLGIPPNIGLLLAQGNVSNSEPDSSYPIFFYDPSIELPGKQLTLNQAKKLHTEPTTSPDGTSFFYLLYDKDQPARTLVVQSVNGQTRKIVLERDYPFGYPLWIDNDHILWMDILDPDIYWSFGGRPDSWEFIPTILIDVQSLEIEVLPPIRFPKTSGQYIIQAFVHTVTENYAFLQYADKDQVSYEIYSYASETSQPVFTWLPAKFFQDLEDTRENVTPNGKLYFMALDGSVFWIMSQSVEQVLSTTDPLADNVYEFTFPEESTPSFVPYYFDTWNAFLYIKQNNLSEDVLESVPQNLYRFDIDSQTIYDYCLDIQRWRGGSSISVSPGEEFVAITLYQDPMTGNGKKDTILINLLTGDRAIVPNYQVFGWVSVNN